LISYLFILMVEFLDAKVLDKKNRNKMPCYDNFIMLYGNRFSWVLFLFLVIDSFEFQSPFHEHDYVCVYIKKNVDIDKYYEVVQSNQGVDIRITMTI
jgi:hypothetical protein